ncbi:MAG: V-type ATP synthase subunit F [Deinococcus sp.]|nr:V-type ATP synthase subunit F [Deinococcus sp.]
MAVLTDPETASGYRLAGLEAHSSTPQEAGAKLASLVASNAYALIAVDEGLLADPYKAVEKIMRGRQVPVLVTVPELLSAFSGGQDATAYMKRLVRETIGFDIKL